MERVIDRFNKYMTYKNLNDNQVTTDLGLSVGLLGKSRKEERDLSKKSIEKILNFYTDLNDVWLKSGSGPMINRKPYELPEKEQNNLLRDRKEVYRSNGEHGVPYYDIDISATITESFNDVAEVPEFYVDFKPFNDCSAYLPIWGDSMFPEYTAGDIVAVKKIKNFDIILPGEVYLVITNEEGNNMRTIKKVWPNPEDQVSLILRSSNPKYAGDILVPKEFILSMYVVKGKITRKQL